MQTKNLFNKDFLLVVIGQIISLFGNAILRFALPLYLLRETGSASLFGIVTAISFLPMIFLSFIGGILADRTNKRNIMVILDFLTAFIVFIFFISFKNVSIVPLIICVMILLYGISGTYQPTVQASIPVLVTKENILSANAIINQISSLSNLLGPIIGGMLFGSFGISSILIISMICFFASAVMEIFIRIPFEKRNDVMGVFSIVKKDFTDCTTYLKTQKPILIKIISLVAMFNLILSAMIIIGIPVIMVDIIGVSDELFGLSQGAFALGGLCGGILIAILGNKLKLKNSTCLLLICSLCVGVMAIPLLFNMPKMTSYLIITIMNFVIMTFATMFTIQMISTIQTETPSHLVGKVIAFTMSVSMSAQPIGQTIYGVIFDKFANNIGMVLIIVSILSILLSLISKKIFARIND